MPAYGKCRKWRQRGRVREDHACKAAGLEGGPLLAEDGGAGDTRAARRRQVRAAAQVGSRLPQAISRVLCYSGLTSRWTLHQGVRIFWGRRVRSLGFILLDVSTDGLVTIGLRLPMVQNILTQPGATPPFRDGERPMPNSGFGTAMPRPRKCPSEAWVHLGGSRRRSAVVEPHPAPTPSAGRAEDDEGGKSRVNGLSPWDLRRRFRFDSFAGARRGEAWLAWMRLHPCSVLGEAPLNSRNTDGLPRCPLTVLCPRDAFPFPAALSVPFAKSFPSHG